MQIIMQNEVWLTFGMGKLFRYHEPIHKIVCFLGPENNLVLQKSMYQKDVPQRPATALSLVLVSGKTKMAEKLVNVSATRNSQVLRKLT